MSRKDLDFTDIDDNFFGDAPTGLEEASKDPFTASSIIGLGIAGLGIVAGGVAVKKARDKKLAREKIQQDELNKLMKELEEIKKMK